MSDAQPQEVKPAAEAEAKAQAEPATEGPKLAVPKEKSQYDAKRCQEKLNASMEEMFAAMGEYARAELSSATKDFALLRELNEAASRKYDAMSETATKLSVFLEDMQSHCLLTALLINIAIYPLMAEVEGHQSCSKQGHKHESTNRQDPGALPDAGGRDRPRTGRAGKQRAGARRVHKEPGFAAHHISHHAPRLWLCTRALLHLFAWRVCALTKKPTTPTNNRGALQEDHKGTCQGVRSSQSPVPTHFPLLFNGECHHPCSMRPRSTLLASACLLACLLPLCLMTSTTRTTTKPLAD